MPAGKYNIDAEQGADFALSLTWTEADAAVNLTGYSARMQVRKTHAATVAVVSLTDGDGITLGGSAGTIYIDITNAVLAAIPAGDYVYDCELVSPTGKVTRIIEGRFRLMPEVTR